ncbi:hypothetical protein [Pantoea cypripedii]|uniref:Uncharacterized protein n=1 Tax=Pantoea cypripedii TaxID=55209 RepID=A0A6B9GFL0_PANCY|nr:hypothetical protein [Pantoea cypripedii]QGY32499.1 hypothetical protein CUN67_26390 [Pantoea cypripedii]
MTAWLMNALANTPLRQCFIYGTMLIIVAYALLRTAGNLREIRRLGQHRAKYYALREWGISAGPLRIFLLAECLVVNSLSVLMLLVLSEITLW